ncbi:MAG: von Willebrand factor type A domain-containing protein [Oscillospiraceae bacterium]|nr:von Willebrand factor type A domain-containing protein [Oscillospiraceae bacterium]
MKKLRKTALFLTVVLTAAFYDACGAKNEEGTSYNYVQYNKNNSVMNIAPEMAKQADADGLESFDDAAFADADQFVNSEEYSQIIENTFINTTDEPVSTFSIDVDTASYANIRRMIQEGYSRSIPADAVRIEEMINYFNYDYPVPQDDAPFSVTTELSGCPWNPAHELCLIGLQADKIDLNERMPMNLVFLIDVSGSMYGEDRLGLVQKAVNMLAENLNENDTVSIVTYAGREAVLLEGTPGNDVVTITNAINNLEAGGSTAGGAGIVKAYEIAEKYFIPGGNNRILLATDGDLNVGLSSAEELKALVEEKRESGVNLSVLGFGTGNLKDDRLETLADYGNGNYSYIDSELEAQKVLVQEMGGTLYTVAKDVKLQLEFSPETVRSYRLIGYENRVLANEDFNNDKVDAGEIGAGHSVTALYEIIPADAPSDNLMTLSMRYKKPDGEQSQLREFPVTVSGCRTEQISKNSAFAGAVAEFGMLLRNSSYAGMSSYSQIMELLSKTDIQDQYRSEFRELVQEVYQAGMIPESVDPASIPQDEDKDVTTESATAQEIPENSDQNSQQDPAQSKDYALTAYYHGNPVELFEEEWFVSVVEEYIDLNTETGESADGAIEASAKQNGIYVDIFYSEEIYGKDGKMLTLKGTTEPYSVYGITILIDESTGTEQLIVNHDGYRNVYAIPEVIQNELRFRIGEENS